MLDDYIRKQYPKLAEVYDKRGGDKKLSLAHDAIVAKMSPIRETLNTYAKEEARGIMHTPEWNTKMLYLNATLRQLEKDCVAALDAWKASCPPYDDNNRIADCGCVIINGERVHWCGDHY